MPSIKINKTTLFNSLNINKFTDQQFTDLCFEYGLELDDITTEENTTYYHIDIPANRFDLLCLEGLSIALRAYLLSEYQPIKYLNLNNDIQIKTYKTVDRPFIDAFIIKNIKNFNLKSFIEYQEKLHLTLGRCRSLIAIGTHDLDKVLKINFDSKPLSIIYQYQRLSSIKFSPLNSNNSISGAELREYFKNDKVILNYFNLLSSLDASVVFTEESTGTVISVPPIINSDVTKISESTKNIFIEITGNNENKVNQAMKLLINNFRGEKVEYVKIIKVNDESNMPEEFNFLSSYETVISKEYINKKLKLDLSVNQIQNLLSKMMYETEILLNNRLKVIASPSRTDVFNECDIIEDIAVAYGFNNFKMSLPDFLTIGSENGLNKFSNKIREEIALCGYNELLTLTLLSKEEAFDNSIYLKNYKSKDCEIIRSSLLPGAFKSIFYNQRTKLPIKVFEISDVVLKTKADKSLLSCKNKRYFTSVIANNCTVLEEIQGALSFILKKCGFNDIKYCSLLSINNLHFNNYTKFFIAEHSAEVFIQNQPIGIIGVVNPITVNKEYGINYPLCAFEVDLEILHDCYLK